MEAGAPVGEDPAGAQFVDAVRGDTVAMQQVGVSLFKGLMQEASTAR